MKRVISGLFLLIALGALGLILAGALSSGEQLVVRFLTAIIVAAIGLYVISDLRLQSDDEGVAPGPRPPVTGSTNPPTEPPAAPAQAPAPAFMPTVTGKRGSLFGPPSAAGDLDATLSVVAEATSVANGHGEDLRLGGAVTSSPVAGDITIERPEVARADERLRASARPVAADIDDTLTSAFLEEVEEAPEWPPVTGSVAAIVPGAPAPTSTASTASAAPATGSPVAGPAPAGRPDPFRTRITTGELEGLVTLFSQQPPADVPVEAPVRAAIPAPAALADLGAETLQDAPAVAEAETDDRTRELALAGLRRPPSLISGPEALVASPAPSPFGRLNATGTSGGVGLLERPATGPGPSGIPSGPSSPITGGTAGGGIPVPAGPGSGGPGPVEPLGLGTIAAASYTRAPLADVIDLRQHRTTTSPEIETAIRAGEIEVISSLMGQGRLTNEGPITDRDVRTMVYVAFTSSELRKLLMAGGTIDGDNSGIDLGEVEVFYRPALGAGPAPAATALPVLSPPPAAPSALPSTPAAAQA